MKICKKIRKQFLYLSQTYRNEYFTKLRLGLCHLHYHKFKHGFLDAVDPLCSYSSVIQDTVHYFLQCPNFSTARNTFLNEIAIVDISIIDQDKMNEITFLYGNPTYSVNDNKSIIVASIKYILETKIFDRPILYVQCIFVKVEQIKLYFHYYYYFVIIIIIIIITNTIIHYYSLLFITNIIIIIVIVFIIIALFYFQLTQTVIFYICTKLLNKC